MKSKNQNFFFLFGFWVSLVFSCSPSITTYSVKTKKVDLRNYKTYAWVIPKDTADKSRYDDKIFARYIIDLTNFELEKKGFKMDTDNPDAIFTFDTRLEKHVEYTQSPSVSMGVGFGGPFYYGSYSAPINQVEVTAKPYYQGMLFIRMYDEKTNQLLWKAWAEERVTYDRDLNEDLQTAIRKMFIRLPVKHKWE